MKPDATALLRPFDRLPISRKLTVISVLTITLALLVSSVVFLIYDRWSVEEMIARRARNQADTIAFNSATAVLLGDADSAARTLSGLESDPHVISARILAEDGQSFAEYTRPGEAKGGEVVVSRPLSFKGRPLGVVEIRVDLREQEERFSTYLVIEASVFLIAFGIALSFGRAAQRSIAEPILELARAAERIGDDHELSVRPVARSEDEVGALVAAFNHMLDGRQRRDEALQATQRALERQIKEADEASRLKDEFLATLSHELRTPLNAILGWAQILRRGGLEGEAADRALETISRNALAQGRIIADILDMQRIAAGKLRLTLQSVDLALVARRAIDTVSPAARVKEIEIFDSMDGATGPVLGDAGRLQQVLWNLLSNAVKFTPRGGQVLVELRKVGAHAELVVADSGPGLDPSFIPFAFDRFRQGDSSSTRRKGGLGLGLAIVKDLVELHGGSVTAANREDGGGACFSMNLPLLGGHLVRGHRAREGRYPENERQVSLALAPNLDGIRVLVVDDEPDSREVAAAALTRCGAEVTSASSAEEGFAALKQSRPHVVLSDLEMPDEDGYSLVRRIRALPAEEGGTTPAAAFTAYAGAEDRVRALGAGFQVHVPKPVQPAELVAVVSNLARGPAR